MAGVMDFLGDLIHHPIDTVSGALGASSAPNKPGYTATDASGHLGGMTKKGADALSGRQAQIDQAVKDAGG